MTDRASAQLTGALEVRILGPLEVLRGDVPVEIGSAKQRALLGVLLLYPNQVISASTLLDELWAQDLPASASKMLQVLVSRIRKNLAADDGVQVVTRSPGYVAKVRPDRLDSLVFEALANRGMDTLELDPSAALADLEKALALWRGEPLSNVRCGPRAGTAIARLDELRLAVAEARIDAGFALGRHAELTSDLTELVRIHPFRERLTAQLMVALYRSGRQAEALEAYRRTRNALRDELGIEPSAELRTLEIDILNQDLDVPREGAPPTPADAALPDLRAPEVGPPRQRPRRAAIVAGTVAAAISVGVLVATLPRSRTAHPTVRPRSLAIFDGSTMRLVGDIPVGANPGAVALDETTAWVANRDDHTISELNLSSDQVLQTIGIGSAPRTVSVAEHRVWIGNGFDGTLTRILSPFNQVSSPFYPGPTIHGLLAIQVSPGDLWVGLANNTILRLDPTDLQVKATIPMPRRVLALAADNNVLWSIAFQSEDVSRIDPARAVGAAVTRLPTQPSAITVGGGSVWVATGNDDRLWRIDATTYQAVASVPLGIDPGAIVYGAGAVWISSSTGGKIDRVDPSTMDLVRTIHLGHDVGGMACSSTTLLITID